jgi:D-glycero-D-manno-heptose 1,7-bisphosphate phosphatase
MSGLRKAAFIDRDGVINVDSGYVGRWEDFRFAPDAVAMLQRLADEGYLLVVITNQSGIARGYFSEADYELLTDRYREALAAQGIRIAAVYHCPHHPQGTVAQFTRSCDCRKPAPGMILRAIRELGIDPAASILIGDSERDIEAGRAAGVGRLVRVERAI